MPSPLQNHGENGLFTYVYSDIFRLALSSVAEYFGKVKKYNLSLLVLGYFLFFIYAKFPKFVALIFGKNW